MDDWVVRIGTLGEFTAEVCAPDSIPDSSIEPHRPMVRLHLLDRLTNGPSLPAKILELHLQGLNDSGEILWLMKSHEITWLPDRGPASPAIKRSWSYLPGISARPTPHTRGRVGPLSFASGMAQSLFWVNARLVG